MQHVEKSLKSEQGFSAYEQSFIYACQLYEKIGPGSRKKRERVIEHAEYANSVWFGSDPCQTHEYLIAKGVKSFGLRKHNGMLIAPIHDFQHVIWNFYPIQHDLYYPLVGRLEGGYFHIGMRDMHKKLFVCVDYESAASIHEATGAQVVVVFRFPNIPSVLNQFLQRHKSDQIILAISSPAEPQGTEEVAIRQLVKATGCQLRMPEEPMTSWNDVHVKHGLQAMAQQLNWE